MDSEIVEKREALLLGIFKGLDVDDFFDAFSKVKPEERIKAIIELLKLTKTTNDIEAVKNKIIYENGKLIIQNE